MRKASAVVGVVVGVVAILSTVSSVTADPRFHGRSGVGRFSDGRSFRGHGPSFHNGGPSFHKDGFHRDGFGRHRFFPRHFGAFGVVVAPPLVVFAPPLFDPSPPFYNAPVYAPPVSPPAVYVPPVSPPVMYGPPVSSQPPAPTPQVVQYPNGRYELRGDGISTPYTWVWIPNPPPPPPAPPTAPPAGAPNGSPMSGDPPPTRPQVYQWVDEQGVAHWTNRLEAVPRRYREATKRLEPS